jgi:hypothetical protein
MTLQDAHRILQQVLAPMPLDVFLDETLGRRVVKVGGEASGERVQMLGDNPERAILEAYGYFSPKLGYHAAEPSGPPPVIEPAADAAAFKAKIEAFHANGYTVRIPALRWASAPLDRFCRALECVLHQQVKAEAFWSRGDAKAPVHHDDYDIIVIQLKGRKRWFISGDPSELPNAWKGIPDASTLRIDNEQVVEVGPGDLLYLPRGTKHRVEALADSLHISIGFVPLTVREAILATLDHFSDLQRGLRVSVGDRLSTAVARDDFADIAGHIRQGVAALAQLCASDDFIAEALQQRSSRAISALDKLEPGGYRPEVTAELRVRRNPLALCHLSANAEMIDFSHPGGHIYVHRGAEEGVRFIATTPAFRVREVPGPFNDDVRFALVQRFLDAGFLQAVVD